MSMIPTVGPCCFWSIEPRGIHVNELCTSIGIPIRQTLSQKQRNKGQHSPLNLKEWNIIETPLDILLHFIHVGSFQTEVVLELCCSPIHLNEVSFTMILWVEIADVATRCNEFLKSQFLAGKVWLRETCVAAAARHGTDNTFETFTLR